MGLLEVIKGKKIYLDTNIFIYAVEGYEEYLEHLDLLFNYLEHGLLQAITSELSLSEVLVKPMIDENIHLQNIYQDMIQTSSSLEVINIDRKILIESANIRSKTKIKLPDSIHGATAIFNNCSDFLTNDKQLNLLPDINVIILEDLLNK
ncbi:type II toxin-antitoxin system VapC family toxin [Cyanobacterium sp. Dongsha4]|uniref:type II toxin-antitoxin system VapC family toxin n=1 Tax=Cyanobacterium sp. DS4 TaxID=2878255 RepID=UPI002E814D26|nr:PIN domain-containing protein [Cyanobacterium sp. Dongsha4]WVL00643.1 PIN domain-containing protein [Cyanobacterium sp. Dongsha4]